MLIISDYQLVEKPSGGDFVWFVVSLEQHVSPCCGGALRVISSRKRVRIRSTGVKERLIIRRLRCQDCGRTHSELPDCLVPYKRYDSASIEAVVSGDPLLDVAADESTLLRWKTWFSEMVNYFLGCLQALILRYRGYAVEVRSDLPESSLQRIWHYVGNAPCWLARVVRPVANANLWVQTRFAFLSG